MAEAIVAGAFMLATAVASHVLERRYGQRLDALEALVLELSERENDDE